MAAAAAGAGKDSDPPPSQQDLEGLVLGALEQVLGSCQVDGGSCWKPPSSDTPLLTAGLNSSSAVQLTSLLEQKLGVQLPATLIFDYPSVNSITEFLLQEDIQPPQEQPSPPPTSHPASSVSPHLPRAAAGSQQQARPVAPEQHLGILASQGPATSNLDILRAALVKVMDDGHRIPTTAPLLSAGLTSTAAVQLTGALEDVLGVSLPATLVFDYPSLDDIARYLEDAGVGAGAGAREGAGAGAGRGAGARRILHEGTEVRVLLVDREG
jgi:acyl carrier protein